VDCVTTGQYPAIFPQRITTEATYAGIRMPTAFLVKPPRQSLIKRDILITHLSDGRSFYEPPAERTFYHAGSFSQLSKAGLMQFMAAWQISYFVERQGIKADAAEFAYPIYAFDRIILIRVHTGLETERHTQHYKYHNHNVFFQIKVTVFYNNKTQKEDGGLSPEQHINIKIEVLRLLYC
jgi:hypothetical protein